MFAHAWSSVQDLAIISVPTHYVEIAHARVEHLVTRDVILFIDPSPKPHEAKLTGGWLKVVNLTPVKDSACLIELYNETVKLAKSQPDVVGQPFRFRSPQ